MRASPHYYSGILSSCGALYASVCDSETAIILKMSDAALHLITLSQCGFFKLHGVSVLDMPLCNTILVAICLSH